MFHPSVAELCWKLAYAALITTYLLVAWWSSRSQLDCTFCSRTDNMSWMASSSCKRPTFVFTQAWSSLTVSKTSCLFILSSCSHSNSVRALFNKKGLSHVSMALSAHCFPQKVVILCLSSSFEGKPIFVYCQFHLWLFWIVNGKILMQWWTNKFRQTCGFSKLQVFCQGEEGCGKRVLNVNMRVCTTLCYATHPMFTEMHSEWNQARQVPHKSSTHPRLRGWPLQIVNSKLRFIWWK